MDPHLQKGNPLIEALPPATDYLTYLTIIEYNLTTENLPTLHDVLQDTKLTTNIGWDLVHLLMPLLPASEHCLEDIARLGNPREVILKVTESLRLIDYEGLEPAPDEYPAVPGAATEPGQHSAKTAAIGGRQTTQAVELPPPAPLPVLQFTTMLSMLSILHPRIKTQYPSRFLSTTLQAVLASFSHAVSHREDLLFAIVRFVKTLSGTKRPHLPPRKSSVHITSVRHNAPAPDPEPDTESVHPSSSESDMQQRLLQSFLTYALEDYMLGLASNEDIPGLAWCARLQERLHPQRTVPGKPSMSDRFNSDDNLNIRLSAMGEILALSRDLNIRSAELMTAANSADDGTARGASGEEEDGPPKSAADIPLSKTGSLFLFTARTVVETLYYSREPDISFDLFPVHQELLHRFTSDSSTGAMVGSEPEAVLDALLVMSLLGVEANRVGEPADAEQFNQYLQTLSLISSNCPSPTLRYHAFYLTTTILRSNPSDMERLAFIRDTLEHCPFDNLKVAAVSWIKGETIEANPPTPLPSQTHAPSNSTGHETHSGEEENSSTVFSTPVALDSLAPFLFPDLTHDLFAPSLIESWTYFDQNLHFYLASLNFYYLLLSAKHLHKALGLGDLHTNNDVAGSFLQPLRDASSKFRQADKEGGELQVKWEDEHEVEERLGELEILDATLEKVTAAVAGLNTT